MCETFKLSNVPYICVSNCHTSKSETSFIYVSNCQTSKLWGDTILRPSSWKAFRPPFKNYAAPQGELGQYLDDSCLRLAFHWTSAWICGGLRSAIFCVASTWSKPVRSSTVRSPFVVARREEPSQVKKHSTCWKSVIARPPWCVSIARALTNSIRRSPARIASLHFWHFDLLLGPPSWPNSWPNSFQIRDQMHDQIRDQICDQSRVQTKTIWKPSQNWFNTESKLIENCFKTELQLFQNCCTTVSKLRPNWLQTVAELL